MISKKTYHICFALFLCAVLIYRYAQVVLLHQLSGAPQIFVSADNTFWLFHLLGIVDFVFNHALFFDLFMLASTLALLFFSSRFFAFLGVVAFSIYYISFHSVFMHHGHSMVAIIFAFVPLLFKTQYFDLLFEAVRYYALFVYASSGMYKLFRLEFLQYDYFSKLLEGQFYSLQPTFLASYLIEHVSLACFFWIFLMLAQLSFFGGFFTKRLDKWYALFIFLFHLLSNFIMNLQFFELYVFLLFFLPSTLTIIKKQFLKFVS